MKTYDVLSGFWHKSIFRAVGSKVELDADVAKYLLLGGTIREAAPAPAAEPVPA
jgi:hypothetical protein